MRPAVPELPKMAPRMPPITAPPAAPSAALRPVLTWSATARQSVRSCWYWASSMPCLFTTTRLDEAQAVVAARVIKA